MAYIFTGTYDAKAVANYFLGLARKEGKALDPLGIQVLVYFAHGWNLAVNGRPLISERIEAGRNGPIIRDLYEEFSRFGYAPITELAKKLSLAPGTPLGYNVYYPQITDPNTMSLLNQVWDAYKRFTSIQLSNMTHDAGSPWRLAVEQHQPFIDDSLLQNYFVSQMNAA
jgi:uncharacterized phage-associated protein